jgi:hypothetical protein
MRLNSDVGDLREPETRVAQRKTRTMKQTYILFQESTLLIPTQTNWRMHMYPCWVKQQKETFDEIQANVIGRINENLRTYHKYLIMKM